MLRSKLAVAFCIFLLVPACSSAADEPTDPSDAGYLPTGTYALTMADASCNVNASFRSAERTALFRNAGGKPTGVNLPLPGATTSQKTSMFGMARRDIDLKTRQTSFEQENAMCGAITTTLDVKELTAKRIVVTYRETPSCETLPACSVEYALDLVEAACPRACVSRGATLDVAASGSLTWHCQCE
jgi:hypothetical protein